MTTADELAALRERALTGDVASMPALLAGLAQSDATGPEVAEVVGVARYRSGDTVGGAAALAEAAKDGRHAFDARSLVLLMRAQYGAGDMDAALATAKRALSIDPTVVEAMKTAARICNQRKDWDRAERFWRELCDASPGDAEAPLQVARIAARRSEQETVEFFSDLQLARTPDNTEALKMNVASRVFLGLGREAVERIGALYREDPEAARASLRGMARHDDPEAEAEGLALCLAIDPSDVDLQQHARQRAQAWSKAALNREVEADDRGAARLFRAALKLEPDQRFASDGLRRLRSEALTEMRNAFRGGDHDLALKHAADVVAIDPAVSEAWFTQGRIHQAAGRNAEAADSFAEAVKAEPGDAWGTLNLGRSLERAERYAEALVAYRLVIDLIEDPAHAHRAEAAQSLQNSLNRLARQTREAYRAGDNETAWKLNAAAEATGVAGPEVETMKAAILRALFIGVRDAHAENSAIMPSLAQAYLAKDPSSANVLVMLGRRLMADRLHREALPVWVTLSEIEPANAHYWLQTARCCSWLRLPEPGLEAARRALALDPNLAEADTLRVQSSAR